MLKSLIKKFVLETHLTVVIDFLMLPATLAAGAFFKAARRIGLQRFPQNRRALLWMGVLPIRRHYYEPFVHPTDLRQPLDAERQLPGIDWNMPGQLEFLRTLRYESELEDLTGSSTDRWGFRLNNGSFESGDAEFLYQLIRRKKPKRIFEVGSGHSTLLVRRAIERNRAEVSKYECKHVCIEPYEARWLEALGITVLRKQVEDVDIRLFSELEADDLLFIDSSHVIRPQGDVVTEYLQVLPSLRSGVVVHVHDIFSPRDYCKEWVFDRLRLWNEQYLLEAFLTNNDSWSIIAALNLLHHNEFDELHRVCPYLTMDREPGSFYMQRV